MAVLAAKPTAVAAAPNNKGKQDHAVQIFLRVRPLIPEEEGHKVIEYKTSCYDIPPTSYQFQLKLPPPPPRQVNPAFKVNPGFSGAPPLQRQRDEWKVYGGFTNILQDNCTNEHFYQATMQPLVSSLAQETSRRNTACIFTYGHTGSGKSHTLLGYDEELGIYKFAARELVPVLQTQNKQLLVRVTELYNKGVHDLLTGEACSIRQDSKGIVQVRGPMVEEDDQGRLIQQPLGKLCSTIEQVEECVEKACASRRVGTSTHHSQSSRSHLLVEFEVVTEELVKERHFFITQEAELTRLKWLQTERMMGKHRAAAAPMPKWTDEYNSSINGGSKLRKDIQASEALVRETKARVTKLERNLGGTLVFCDLAGNEYARDAAGSSREELEEATQINKSLLAVKEMIRSLRDNKHKNNHVPYRDSKLTMMLRRHMDHRAIMLAHLSPSQESLRKTINTLNYSATIVTKTSSSGDNGSCKSTSAATKQQEKGGKTERVF